MPRYVALLRGVSPMNAKMPQLKACFEKLGFNDVKTVLSSGNVVFTAPRQSETKLVQAIEAGMAEHLPRSFPLILRTSDHLLSLIETDPYAGFHIPPSAKRVVTFLGHPHQASLSFPIEFEAASILSMRGNDVFTSYVPNEHGPVFMSLLEKTFGKNITTRTWDTVKKCAAA